MGVGRNAESFVLLPQSARVGDDAFEDIRERDCQCKGVGPLVTLVPKSPPAFSSPSTPPLAGCALLPALVSCACVYATPMPGPGAARRPPGSAWCALLGVPFPVLMLLRIVARRRGALWLRAAVLGGRVSLSFLSSRYRADPAALPRFPFRARRPRGSGPLVPLRPCPPPPLASRCRCPPPSSYL